MSFDTRELKVFRCSRRDTFAQRAYLDLALIATRRDYYSFDRNIISLPADY